MTVFVLPKLNGLTANELSTMSSLEHGYATEDDIANHNALRIAVLEDMREAGENGDLDRVEYLDGLYQELLDMCSDLVNGLHNDENSLGYEQPLFV